MFKSKAYLTLLLLSLVFTNVFGSNPTKLVDNQCGTTLSAIDQTIYCFIKPLVIEYKFEINYGGTTEYVVTDTNKFDLNSTSFVGFNRNYYVRVATKLVGETSFGSYGDQCLVRTPGMPTTRLVDADCGKYIDVTYDGFLYCLRNDASEGYRFEVKTGTSYYAPTQVIEKETNKFKLSEIGTLAEGTQYRVRVAGKYGGIWAPYAETCYVTTKKVTKITSCDQTLSSVSSNVYCNSVVGAEKYRFELTKGDEVKTYDSVYNRFVLSNVFDSVFFDETFSVRVAVKYPNNEFEDFGEACSIRSPVQTTEILSPACGETLNSLDDSITCQEVEGATSYVFSLVNYGNNQSVTHTSVDNKFALSEIEGFAQPDQNIRVSAAIINENGNQGAFSSFCVINTPVLPTTKLVDSNCNSYREANVDNWVYCFRDDNVEGYRFEIKKGTNWYTSPLVFETESNKIKLSESGPITPNTIYRIRAAGKYNGIWAKYGDYCTITTKGATELTFCEQNLSQLSTRVYCNALSGVEQYKFEVSKGEDVRTYTSNYSYFSFSNLSGETEFDAEYSVRVAVKYPNEEFGIYGTVCVVNTPIEQTKIVTAQCGNTLNSGSELIYCDPVQKADEYIFSLYNYNTGKNATHTSSTNSFKLTDIDDFSTSNQRIRIRVAVQNKDGRQGNYGDYCTIETPLLPLTKLVDSNCGSFRDATDDNWVYCFRDDASEGYRFEIRDSRNTSYYYQPIVFETDVNKFKFSEFTTVEEGGEYSIRAAAKYNGVWAAYGDACSVTFRGTTKITSCGSTLSSISRTIYCDALPNVSFYKFEVTNENQSRTVIKLNNYFSLSDLEGEINYDTDYSIRVAAGYPGEEFGTYGEVCTIRTPIEKTQLVSSFCFSVLESGNTLITCDPVDGADKYIFNLYNYTTRKSETFESDTNSFRLTDIDGYSASDQQVRIRVAVKNAQGELGSYGNDCTVTTPTLPTTKLVDSNCNSLREASLDQWLYCYRDDNVEGYRFEIKESTYYNAQVQIVTTDVNKFKLSDVVDVVEGKRYYVRAAGKYNGAWAKYGDQCTVTTKAKTKLIRCENELGYMSSNVSFSGVVGAEAYKIELSNGSDIIVYETNTSYFRLTEIEHAFAYDQEYSVRIAVKYPNNDFEAFGEVCTIRTPIEETKLMADFCDATLDKVTSLIYCEPVDKAFEYEFNVQNLSTNSYEIVTTKNNFLRLTDLTDAAIADQEIRVKVAVRNNEKKRGNYGESCTVRTPSLPKTKLVDTSCDVIREFGNDSFLYCFRDDTSEAYRFEVSRYNFIEVFETDTNKFKLSDVVPMNPGMSYNVRAAGKYEGAWAAFGESCKVTIKGTPELNGCGGELKDYSSIGLNKVPEVEKYKFEIRVGEEISTIETTEASFKPRDLEGGFYYNSTYKVRVALQYPNESFGEYSKACTYTTEMGETQIESSFCNTTLERGNSVITCSAVDYADEYVFKLYNYSTNRTVYYTSETNSFSLTDVEGFSASDQRIRINVAIVNAEGEQGEYGSSCTIFTPELPLTKLVDSNCNSTRDANSDNWIYCYRDDTVEGYRFEVRQGTLSYSPLKVIETDTNKIKLSDAFQFEGGEQYSIRVAGKYEGTWAKYGETCKVYIKGASKLSSCDRRIRTFNEYISCGALPGVEKYRFELSDGNDVQVYDTSSNGFRLTDFSDPIDFDTEYVVRVAVKYPNEEFSSFGEDCTVQSPIQTTQLLDAYCGKTLEKGSLLMYCEEIEGVSEYVFYLDNYSTYRNIAIRSETNSIRLTDIENFVTSGQRIRVQVAIVNSTGEEGERGQVCFVTLPELPSTKLVDASCDIIREVEDDNWLYCFRDDATEGYRFDITGDDFHKVIETETNKFKLSDVTTVKPNSWYRIKAAGKYDGVWADYGSLSNSCLVTIKGTSRLSSNSCGKTISGLGYNIYCDNMINAEAYKFELVSGDIVHVLERSTNNFYLSHVEELLAYDTVYEVRVAVKYPGEDFGPYGEACNIKTPISTTQLVGELCGTTLESVTSRISCNSIEGAEKYVFEISAGYGGSYSGLPFPYTNRVLHEANTNSFSLSEIENMAVADLSLKVRVAVINKEGAQGDFGPSCDISTPSLPQTRLVDSNCDVLREEGIDSWIYCYRDDATQGYRFEVEKGSEYSNEIYVYESDSNKFKLSDLDIYESGEKYYVRAAGKYDGAWAAYGESCVITTKERTKLNIEYCGVTLHSASSNIVFDQVKTAVGYQIEITEGNNVYNHETNWHNFKLTDVIKDFKYETEYTVRIAATYTGDEYEPFGEACVVRTPIPTTQLITGQCQGTLLNPDDLIYCQEAPGASAYLFSLQNYSNGSVRTFLSDANSMRLTDVEGFVSNQSVSIKVAVINSEGKQGEYGSSCSVKTPELPTLTLVDSYCNAVRSLSNTSIVYSERDDNAEMYRFEIQNISIANSPVKIIEAESNKINLAESVRLMEGSEYAIRVAGKYGSAWAAYGNSCSIFIKGKTSLQNCDESLTSLNSKIYCNTVPGLVSYKFEVSNGEDVRTIESTENNFSFSQFEGDFINDSQYGVRVAVKYFGESEYESYGKSCFVKTPLSKTELVDDQCGISLVDLNQELFCKPIDGALRYQFHCYNYNTREQRIVRAETNSFKLNGLDGFVQAGQRIEIRVIYVNQQGQSSHFGKTCTISIPELPVTKLVDSNCGAIRDVSLDQWLYCYRDDSSESYRFEVHKGGYYNSPVVVFETSSNKFKLSDIGELTEGVEYRVRVSMKYDGVWSQYGEMCSVYTRGKSKLSYCDGNVTNINSYISARQLPGVAEYKFEVSLDDAVQEILSEDYIIRYDEVEKKQEGSLYNVRVAVRYQGEESYGEYGPVCTFNTPVVTTQLSWSSCNQELEKWSDLIYCDEVSGAKEYIFSLHSSYSNPIYYRSQTNSFRLTDLDEGLTANSRYTVRVSIINRNDIEGEMGTSCSITTPGLNTTKLVDSNCGTYRDISLDQWLYCYRDDSSEGYRFEVTKMSGMYYSRPMQVVETETNKFKLSDLKFEEEGMVYSVRAAVKYNGHWSSYGETCEVITKGKSKLKDCELQVTSSSSRIECVALPGVELYRFEVTRGDEVVLYDTPYDEFSLRSGFEGEINKGEIFSVRVAVQYPGGDFEEFGSSCTVQLKMTVPTVDRQYCGKVLPSFDSKIYCDYMHEAMSYVFEINGKAYATPSNYIKLTDVEGLVEADKLYSVRAAFINKDGAESQFGHLCTVRTPVLPTTQLVDSNCNSLRSVASDNWIYCYRDDTVEKYRFRVVTGSSLDIQSEEIETDTNKFKLSEVFDVQPGVEYRISAAGKYNGVWATYGTSCSITMKGNAVMLPNQCGQNLYSFVERVYAKNLLGVERFMFEVSKDGAVIKELEEFTNSFSFAEAVTDREYNTSYEVRVKSKYQGEEYGEYSPACIIISPDEFTTISVVGTSLNGWDNDINLNTTDGVLYSRRLEFTVGEVKFRANHNWFENWGGMFVFTMPGPPLMGTAVREGYNFAIEEAGEYDVNFNLLTKEYSFVKVVESESRPAFADEPTSAEIVAYPNPFVSEFSISYPTSSDEIISISIFDMSGKQVGYSNLSADELNTATFATNLTNGIYNIVVSQGANTTILRVIKN